MNTLKSSYGYGRRFGKMITPFRATRKERRRALLASTPPLWMGWAQRFCWGQGLRDGVGVISLFSIFKVMGW